VYNAALEERSTAWSKRHINVSKKDQQHQIKDIRAVRPDVTQYGIVPIRGTLVRLDRAFSDFFRRVRLGKTPGYPRFKSYRRFDTVSYSDTSNWRIVDGKLRLTFIGDIKLNIHRQLQGTPKTINIKREGKRWYVSVLCAEVPAKPYPQTDKQLGVDLGVASIATTSDGDHIANSRIFNTRANALAKAQQALALKARPTKKTPSSNRRVKAVARVANHHRKIRNVRLDRNHKLSSALINDNDFLVFEDLKIRNMTKSAKGTIDDPGTNVAAKAGLNKAILDAGWGQLLTFVSYKAAEAGKTLVLVNPRNTSITCNNCQHVDKDNRPTQAKFQCTACGHADHADVNAAKNILRAGLAQHSEQCETQGCTKCKS
jgi:putative transposase